MIQWSLALSWLSSYLLSELGAPITVVATSITSIVLAGSAAEIVSGVMADRIGGANGAVKLLVLSFTASAGALISVVFAWSAKVRLMLVLLSMIAFRVAAPGIWSLVSFLVPVEVQSRFTPVCSAAPPLAFIFASSHL